jgi:LysR family nitrogen assimilation transcriptional regulator
MDIRQLEYFLRVEECGSFTAAAEMLRVAQPSLSRQIRLLETEVRQRLFVRHGRGVISTEAGKQLAEQARLILRQIDLARQSLDRLNPVTSGHLTIGIPSSLVKILVVPLLSEFRARLPKVSLSVTDGLSISMQDWLLSGRLDVALLYKPIPTSEISTISIMDEELFLFCRDSRKMKTTPIKMSEVAELPLILPRNPHEIRMLTERQMASLGRKPNVELEVDSIPAILEFLTKGDHFSILPKYAVSVYANPAAFVARRIIDPRISSKLVIATSTKRATTVVYNDAIKLMIETCSAILDPIRVSSQPK